MRELKFRAWYNDDMRYNSNRVIFDHYAPRNAVIMQYTGLKDKNGKEVYDGDIVVSTWHWTKPHEIQLPRDYYDFSEYAMDDEMTVIGNIYENPELLSERDNDSELWKEKK